ncbi:TlyA family RNA methyltransferase [Homoserinimonas sp. OAct 916]|uniref:TlyA family RNA methyltransferase n=1 Tax=Homoserinimonas sp. OAct 916 TaxID=2211450 RepID=UPI001E31809B|nr:TlyA family RNA methyltransferase [Homoserinimonas sp. OAct 916]
MNSGSASRAPIGTMVEEGIVEERMVEEGTGENGATGAGMMETGVPGAGVPETGVPEAGDDGLAAPQRLDVALTARGLAPSRTRAAQLIAEGMVTVDGEPTLKASVKVAGSQELVVAASDHYVSRAAHKLNAALDTFPVDASGRNALDVGASTGGFTQVLLERGAAHVVALDVGHDQLVAPIRGDARVSVVEGVNARYLTAERLADVIGRTVELDLVVADVSFISLRQVLPAVSGSVAPNADFVVLIKPQFEVGRTGVKEGIVTNADKRADAVAGVLWAAWDLGLGTRGVIASPIAGGAGNKEYLAHLSRGGQNPTEWLQAVSRLCA